MRGYTLIELTFVLLLTGLAASSLAPAARRYRDRAAVLAAREAVVGLLAEARLAAVERGSGRVSLTPDPWRAASIAGDSVMRWVSLAEEFEIQLSADDAEGAVEIRFGPLGLGQVASHTLRFRRGSQVAELVVASYGRVRRR